MTRGEMERLIGNIRDTVWWLEGYLAANGEDGARLKAYHIKSLEEAIDIIIGTVS